MLNNDQFNSLKDDIKTLQTSVNRIDKDMEGDRENIDKLNIRQGKIDEQMESIMGMFAKQTNKLEDKIGDRIAEIAQPIMDSADELADVITDKKMVAIDVEKTKSQKRHWYRLWRR